MPTVRIVTGEIVRSAPLPYTRLLREPGLYSATMILLAMIGIWLIRSRLVIS